MPAVPDVIVRARNPPSPMPSSASITTPQARDLVNPAALTDRLGPVLRNGTGKRVDKVLAVNPSTSYMNFLRQANLCAWYYLRGKCDGCDRNHATPPLKASQFDCLWLLARQGLCYKIRKGKDCDDPKCIYRHEEGHPTGSVIG